METWRREPPPISLNFYSASNGAKARGRVESLTAIVSPMGETENIMRIWLEHDPVALAILVVGIAAVELLAPSF